MGAETREACDEFVQEVVGELFAHDLRVQGMGATVDGGVVHLRGSVEQADELTRLRALIGRIAGVLAVWDRAPPASGDPRPRLW
jgi:hypothetical protein